MASFFKDTEGREWKLAANCDTFSRVKDLTKADLAGIADGSLLAQLDNDPLLSAEVLYALCKPEADARSLSKSDFMAGIDADVGEVAGEALSREIVNFSRKDVRPMLNKILDRAKAMRQATLAAAAMDLDSNLDKAEAELKKSGALSGAALESAASTPDPSPSAS